MAVAGIFSGQMFNFMMGFSLSAILKTINSSKSNIFRLFDWDRKSKSTNYMLVVVFTALLANLSYVYFKMVKINKYKLFRQDAYVSVLFYATVISILVYIQITIPSIYED